MALNGKTMKKYIPHSNFQFIPSFHFNSNSYFANQWRCLVEPSDDYEVSEEFVQENVPPQACAAIVHQNALYTVYQSTVSRLEANSDVWSKMIITPVVSVAHFFDKDDDLYLLSDGSPPSIVLQKLPANGCSWLPV